MDTKRRIGIALGIVMSVHRCTADQAFDVLRTAFQRDHLKLREVAEGIVFTGTTPEPMAVLRSA